MIRANEIQCQPIVIRGKLYGTSGELSLFSLDAATGKELWKFCPFKKLVIECQSRCNVLGATMTIAFIYSAGPHLYCRSMPMMASTFTTFGDQGTIW